MKRALLLRISALICLVICLGHLVGTFMDIPAEQTAMKEAVAIMKRTLVPMPAGSPRSYMQILDGNNLCTSLLLLLQGVMLLSLAKEPKTAASDRHILIVGTTLAGFSAIGAIYFFPVPAILGALAAASSFLARMRS